MFAICFGLLTLAATLATAGDPRFKETDSPHYHIWSSAAEPRTKQALQTAETLHFAWKTWIGSQSNHSPGRHRLRMFASRAEMRRDLPGLGWAEALYHDSICDQYDDRFADRPWQWLVHEATHQLAYEDGHLNLPRWANEGLACLFGTSRLEASGLRLGSVDRETYPTWWLRKLSPSRSMRKDTSGLLVAPSRFLAEPDGIDIGNSVNAHYLSWWSLVHYAFATDPIKFKDWLVRDGTFEGFKRRYGSGTALDQAWYAHVLALADSAKAR